MPSSQARQDWVRRFLVLVVVLLTVELGLNLYGTYIAAENSHAIKDQTTSIKMIQDEFLMTLDNLPESVSGLNQKFQALAHDLHAICVAVHADCQSAP